MHSIHPESSTHPVPDVTGLWFCPPCGEIHGPPPCPFDGQWSKQPDPKRDAGVRLCACCARIAVRSGSPFASFFCVECGARVVAVNRSVGRLVVPICSDLEANLALLPTSARNAATRMDGKSHRSFLDSQIELLTWFRWDRARFLLDRLRLPAEPIELERYLVEVVQLRHESFHAEDALQQLLDTFHEYLIEIPSESPALAAKVTKVAREFPLGFRLGDAKRLLRCGPSTLRNAAGAWARQAREKIQPLPSCLGKHTCRSDQRWIKTLLALMDAAVWEFERVFGSPDHPLPPVVPSEFRAMILAHPGEEWPDYLPRSCPASARVVVGLEDAPALPDLPLYVYQLSMDRRHQWWILWGETVDDERVVTSAPVAWSPRFGLNAKDAGYILLECSLQRDRETFGADRPRPHFEMKGLLDEDLTNVLLDAVWAREG